MSLGLVACGAADEDTRSTTSTTAKGPLDREALVAAIDAACTAENAPEPATSENAPSTRLPI